MRSTRRGWCALANTNARVDSRFKADSGVPVTCRGSHRSHTECRVAGAGARRLYRSLTASCSAVTCCSSLTGTALPEHTPSCRFVARVGQCAHKAVSAHTSQLSRAIASFSRIASRWTLRLRLSSWRGRARH